MRLRDILTLIVFLLLIKIAYGAAPTLNAIPTPQNLTEGNLFNLTVTASDPEGADLNFSDDTAYFNIQETSSTSADINFTPTNAMVGNFIAVIIVIDNESLVDAQAVEFVVNGIPSIQQTLPDQDITSGTRYTYDINGTDPEDGTNVRYKDNESIFEINLTTGVINFTTTDAMVGTYNINITINDTKNANYSENYVLTINDKPSIGTIPANTTPEDQSYTTNLTQFVNNTVGTLTYTDNASFFNINSSTGLVNFTPTNESIGNHTVNISIQDSYGKSNSSLWSLNITPVNDAPTFAAIGNKSGTLNRRFTYDVNATDEEENNITYYDNTSIFAINVTTGLINFTVAQTGTHSINITVNDTGGANYSGTFTLSLVNNTAPTFPTNYTTNLTPSIDNYVDSQFNGTNYQGTEYLELSGGSTSIKRIYLNFSVDELPSSTSIFSATLNLTINASQEGTNLSLSEVNGSWSEGNLTYLAQPTINSSPNQNITSNVSAATDNFNITGIIKNWFNDNSLRKGLSLRVSDESLETGTIKYFSSDHANSTKWPVLAVYHNRTIPDVSLSSGSEVAEAFNLDNYFSDQDGDNLSYTVTNTSPNINITINGSNSVSIKAAGSYSGEADVTFNASDGIDSTLSNTVTINVTATTSSETEDSPSGGGGGGGGGGASRTTVASLSILFNNKRDTISEGESLDIPVTLKNTGRTLLRGITLSLKEDKPGLVTSLSRNYISQLNRGETTDVRITVNAAAATQLRYVLTLGASVNKPSLKESSVVIIDISSEEAGILEQISFAKDFFVENPECLELQELIRKAETQLKDKQYEGARGNLELAIESCKNIIRAKVKESPRRSTTTETIRKALMAASIATMVALLIYFGSKKISIKRKK